VRSSRYNSALFELGQESNSLAAVEADLDRFAALIAESDDLKRLVQSPVFFLTGSQSCCGIQRISFCMKGRRANRFNMARSVLKSFIDRRPNDRIGLVVFAAQAFIATPLTLDHDYLQANLARLEIGTINSDATAIGDGLATAVNRLRDLKAKSKIIILATDGQNNSGKIEPLLAADAAAALGVKVYTVGIGEQGSAPMPVFMNGQKVGYQNVPVDVDEDTLQKIADATGGKYYRADNAEKFQQIYAEIDKLEKTEATINKYTEYKELFPWFVAAGFVLLLIELVLAQTAFRRLP